MNQQAAPVEVQPVSSLHMVLTLGITALCSGLLIVLVYHATLPRILFNQRSALERGIFEVLPEARTKVIFSIHRDGSIQQDDLGSPRLYAGYDSSGQFVGVAIEAAAQGYMDTIRILYGYDPVQECLTGMTVLESRETPGLGDKIERSKAFTDQFQRFSVALDSSGKSLAHQVRTVKNGSKSTPGEIDGISGATISSRAVGHMINESAKALLPMIQQQLDVFRKASL